MTRVTTDVQLADGLVRNAAAGLQPVYEAYADKLYTYALTMLRDPATAQDVVHDALLVAAGAIGQLRDPLKFRPWLYAITRNECLRTLRGRTRFSDTDEVVDVADTVDFEAGLRREEAARLIGQAMAALSPADRDIVALAIQHDLDAERISEVTGATPNTVHARLSRARAGLSDAVSALALFRSPSRCEQLQALIAPADQPLTPLLRKRIQRHVKTCDECERRRRVALAAIGPAMAAPVYVSLPDSLPGRIMAGLQQGQAQPLAQRAAPFDDQGFPMPLDADRRNWLLPAVVGGVGLLVVALVAFMLMGQPEAQPSAAPSAMGTTAPPVSSPAVPLPSAVMPSATEPTPEGDTTPDTDVADPVVPLPTQPAASLPAPSTSAKPTPKPTKTTKGPTPTKSAKPTQTPTPEGPGTPAPTSGPPTQPAPEPLAPEITSATLVNEDQADDGSFTRCDAFTLRIQATVTGDVEMVEARIKPTGDTVALTGDPLQSRITLAPGEYSVTVKATGPGGTATRHAGNVLHICPG